VTADEIRARILRLWFERKGALDAGDPVTASGRAEEMRAYMLQAGVTADRGVARGFAYEGYENLREGNYERAREAFDLARTSDPYLPQAQLGYAWSLLRAGRGVVTFVGEYRRGIVLLWQQFMTDEVQISNFAVVAAIALLLALVIFSLLVVSRCQSRARHDLFEVFRRFFPEGTARVLSWMVFLLPLLVWAGGVWLILFWLALCFRYMRFAEKTAAACIFIMLGLSPVAVPLVVDRFEASTDPETRTVVAAMQGGYNPETLRRLNEVVGAHDASAELHVLLGSSYAKGDMLSEAFDEYQIVLTENPFNTTALVNLGNIYFRLGEFGQAASRYKQAIQADPELTSGHWNLYLAQAEMLHYAEAESSLATARALDPGAIGDLATRRRGETGAALLLEESASLNAIKSALRSGGFARFEPQLLLSNRLSLACGIALGVSLLAALLSLGRRRERMASACARCARPHCPRCRVDLRTPAYCARCVHLFIRTDGTTAEMRAEGIRKVEARDKVRSLIRRVLSLVLPGAGQVMGGRLGIGFPILICWVTAIVVILGNDQLLLTPRVPVTDLPPFGMVVTMVMMACVWILGNTVSSRPPMAAGAHDGA